MDLSRHLALVYQRPEAAILLTIREEAPLSFGNISLPAYLLKIYALPSIIAPTTNLRSTAMLSDELQELLGVGPEFGVIVFIPVPQDNLATNKTTAGGEISRTERAEQAESPSLIRSFGQSLSRRRLKSSSGGSSAPITSPISSTISAALSQPPQSANDDDIVVTDRDRRRQLGVKKSVQNFMRRRLRDKPAEPKEGDQQQPQQESDQAPPEEVQTSEPIIPKREDKVLRWQDQQ